MHRYAIIVAGGSGLRMGAEIPKQFILLEGKPILMHTILKFAALFPQPELIIVLPKIQVELWNELCIRHKFEIDHSVVEGGITRFHSVKNGLSRIVKPDSLVAIHDGVRPFVTKEVIESCYKIAQIKGSAIPVIKPVESVRLDGDLGTHPFDRSKVFLVQTPQVFISEIIRKCYQTEFQPSFTDDASVAEFGGVKINLVEGNQENIKITSPLDLKLAEAIIQGV